MKPALVVIATIVLVLFALAEVLLAMPVVWWLYLALLLLFAIGLLRWQPVAARRSRLTVFVAVVGAIATLYFVPWSTRKPFLHDLYSIRPGMTEADVRRIMGRYMEGTGWPAAYGGTPAGTGTLKDL